MLSFSIKSVLLVTIMVASTSCNIRQSNYSTECIENVRLQYTTTFKAKLDGKWKRKIKGHCICLSSNLRKIYSDEDMALLIQSRIEYTQALNDFEATKPHAKGTKKPPHSFQRFARMINDPKKFRKHEIATAKCRRFGLHSS